MSSPRLRLVRLAPDPLGTYIRAGCVDQKDLQNFISSGAISFTGVVFEAKRVGQQKELLSLVLERGFDAVLDPQTQAMATMGGYAPGMDYEAFRTPQKRLAILDQIQRANIDGLWLNIAGCGSDSSPTAITRYGDAAVDFHGLNVPIVADHAGGLNR